MPDLLTLDNAAALLTLTGLEIVLGIDNIVFIAILCARLPESQRNRARIIGLAAAMITRILLLLTISWIMGLKGTILFRLPEPIAHDFTAKDLVLLLGGLFLVWKSTTEIHHKIDEAGTPEHDAQKKAARAGARFAGVIAQIMLIDIVFSLDSVITAVGMARAKEIMIAAVVISVGVMMIFSGFISRFVDRHPTIKMLALSFLILIGVMLIADSTGRHIEKGYIYFAMAFSLGVESLNIWMRTRSARARAKSTPASSTH